jgi:hypothetical protein
MTTLTDIANRALQVPGTRTLVTDAELAGNLTNEALQINLCLTNIRRRLLRMAPWNCSLKTANLVYITSSPGTPENTSPPTTLWQPGQPTPPWAYEYQYPVDCLRACWMIPATQTGFAGGVPITTAVTGGAASFWQGPPVKFQVQTDTFVPVIGATVAVGGADYAVGDIITLAAGLSTNPPIGAPAQLLVTAVAGGVITTVSVISQIYVGDSQSDPVATPIGGSYFAQQPNPVAQGTTTGLGTGATFNLTYGPAAPQRVILTNQEFATQVYCQDVVDPNIFDDLFQDAYAKIVGATITIPLTGDKKLANFAIQEANACIAEARKGDGNEGLTVNDVTPDWIRIRGIAFTEPYSGPFSGFDWGGMWPIFG